MSSISSPILSVEESLVADLSEQPELLMDSNTQYPDDWPLSSTPLPVPGEGLGGVTTPTGVSTPPLQQLQTAQQTPPLSITTSRLRQSSSVRSSPHRKRLSLSFPVQPAARQVPSAYALPYTPTSPDADLPTPVVSVDFLTVLAAQERRVLELKEELQKAETELSTLKRQWAIHEATKKRHELFQTEARGGSDGEIGGIMSPTLDEQQAKRKAALLKLTQASTRSVSSQRHHRTLSLLSPQRTSYSQPFPQPKDICDNDTDSVRSAAPQRRSDSFPLPRPISMIETSSLALKRNSQDVLLRTGKQMAEGFKEGLWAFVEDLRQATVGEDTRPREAPNSRSGSSLGAPSHNLRKQGSKSSLRSVSSSGTGRRERSPLKSTTESSTPTADSWQAISRASNDDDSSTISPSARWSTSTTLSDIGASSSATPSRSSTPRTSTSSVQSSTSTSGQALQGLQLPLSWGSVMSVSTQFNLKKTATMVMNHVEKTLAMPLVPQDGNNAVDRGKKEIGSDGVGGGGGGGGATDDDVTAKVEVARGVLRRRSTKGERMAKKDD